MDRTPRTCRYSETLKNEDCCRKPATHMVYIPGCAKMALCAEHVKLYENQCSEFRKIPYKIDKL